MNRCLLPISIQHPVTHSEKHFFIISDRFMHSLHGVSFMISAVRDAA